MAGEIAAPTCHLRRSQLQMNIWVESAVKAATERCEVFFLFLFLTTAQTKLCSSELCLKGFDA